MLCVSLNDIEDKKLHALTMSFRETVFMASGLSCMYEADWQTCITPNFSGCSYAYTSAPLKVLKIFALDIIEE
jgi:hypothetical protein